MEIHKQKPNLKIIDQCFSKRGPQIMLVPNHQSKVWKRVAVFKGKKILQILYSHTCHKLEIYNSNYAFFGSPLYVIFMNKDYLCTIKQVQLESLVSYNEYYIQVCPCIKIQLCIFISLAYFVVFLLNLIFFLIIKCCVISSMEIID